MPTQVSLSLFLSLSLQSEAIPVRSLGPYMYVHYCTCIVHILVWTYLFLLTSFFDCLSFCGLFLKHPFKRFFPFYILYFYLSRSLSLTHSLSLSLSLFFSLSLSIYLSFSFSLSLYLSIYHSLSLSLTLYACTDCLSHCLSLSHTVSLFSSLPLFLFFTELFVYLPPISLFLIMTTTVWL